MRNWVDQRGLEAVELALGGATWGRVTTSADVFDDHFESREFLSPGGVLFEALGAAADEGTAESVDAAGHCWLVETGGASPRSEVYVATAGGPAPVRSLDTLIDRLRKLDPTETRGPAAGTDVRVTRLA